jgi:hypothetical protein
MWEVLYGSFVMRIHNIIKTAVANGFFEKEFKPLETTTLTDENYIHEELKTRSNVIDSYFSFSPINDLTIRNIKS